MKTSKFGLFGLVLGGLLLVGAEARAIEVNYVAIGEFAGGTSSITIGDVTVSFSPIANGSVDANPFSLTSFGSFTVDDASDSGAPVAINTTFTLTIFQSDPEPVAPAAVFTATISGTIGYDTSTAFVVFDPPLSQAAGSLVTYQLTNATLGVPGQISLAPETTNGGVTSVEGLITVVPEPSTLALVGLGVVGPLALTFRRRALGRARA